jgi:hypothetical protein
MLFSNPASGYNPLIQEFIDDRKKIRPLTRINEATPA